MNKNINYSLLGFISIWILFFIIEDKSTSSDEGSVCSIAQGISNNLEMYRDYFNEKSPLTYYLHSLIFNFTPHTIVGVRIANSVLLSVTTSIFFYFLSMRVSSDYLKIIYSLGFILFLITSSSFNATTEVPITLLFCTLTLFLLNNEEAHLKTHNVVIGIIMGTCIGFRQDAVLPAVVLLFSPWQRYSRTYYLIGLILGASSWLIYLSHQGLLNQFYEATLFIFNPNISLYLAPAPKVTLNLIKAHYAHYALYLIWFILFAVTSYLSIRKKKLWLIIFALSCSISFFVRRDPFRLWPSFVVLIMILTSLAEENVSTFSSKSKFIWILKAALIILLTFLIIKSVSEIQKEDFNHYEILKNRIQKLTRSNQSILVFSFDPMVYCYSERRPASRFYFITPWIYNKKLLNELTHNIHEKNANLILEDRTLKDLYPDIHKAVDKEYVATEAVEGYVFYEKKQ